MSFNITPVASGYQEIHPYSVMNIDSVKINTSLIMMKECLIQAPRATSVVVEDLPGTKLGSGQSGKVSRIFSARIEDGCWIFQLSHISMTRLSQF